MLLNVFRKSIPWAIAFGIISMFPVASVEAALFDQEDVDPEKFVAIAVPLPQGGRYNLIVLEQKSDTQLCWQETEEEGVIDPLLLGFDFSGICGRSTDSNGYSIRQVGEDLALKYRLTLQKKEGVLVLMGIPLQASYGQPLEIGRTQVLSDGFMEITLNPDWRLTRRMYQGQPLGHLYFTRDVIPPEPVEETTAIVAEADEALDASEAEGDALDAQDEASDSGETVEQIEVEQPDPDEESLDVSEADPEEPEGGESVDEPSTPMLLQEPVQIPVPTPPSSNALPDPAAPPNAASPNAAASVIDVPPTSPLTPIPVPNIAPLGQVGDSEPDVLVSSDVSELPQLSGADEPPPPPFNVALSIQRYRVYVDPKNEAQSQSVKQLAPDSFWTSYQGRRLLQVGAFLKKEEADSLIEALGQQGIDAIINASQY